MGNPILSFSFARVSEVRHIQFIDMDVKISIVKFMRTEIFLKSGQIDGQQGLPDTISIQYNY